MTKVLILAIKTYEVGVVQKRNCFVDDSHKQRILKWESNETRADVP